MVGGDGSISFLAYVGDFLGWAAIIARLLGSSGGVAGRSHYSRMLCLIIGIADVGYSPLP